MTEPPQPQVQEDQEAAAVPTSERRSRNLCGLPVEAGVVALPEAPAGRSRHVVLILIYLIAIFAEFVAPFTA